MREMLFRGKRIDNGEWVYGAYHKHDTVKVCITGDDPKTKHIIIADGFCDWGFEPPLMGYEVDPSTVGQYTEKCDKNGKKIFEGDICHVGHLLYKVEFRYSQWTFNILSNKVYCYPAFSSHCGERCIIIGNIHDNPELLEGAG